jgi:hypothetical protein
MLKETKIIVLPSNNEQARHSIYFYYCALILTYTENKAKINSIEPQKNDQNGRLKTVGL